MACHTVPWCCFCSKARHAPVPRDFTESDLYAGNRSRRCLEKELTWRGFRNRWSVFGVFDSVTTPLGPNWRGWTELVFDTIFHGIPNGHGLLRGRPMGAVAAALSPGRSVVDHRVGRKRVFPRHLLDPDIPLPGLRTSKRGSAVDRGPVSARIGSEFLVQCLSLGIGYCYRVADFIHVTAVQRIPPT